MLATPVELWGGWPFFVRGWQSVINRTLNMFTLIGLGTGVAYAYSVVATAPPDIFPASFRDPPRRSRCLLRGSGGGHDPGLDEARAIGVGIYAVLVQPVRVAGIVAEIIEYVRACVRANRREQSEHEHGAVQMAGDLDAPGAPGQHGQHAGGEELGTGGGEEPLCGLPGGIARELFRNRTGGSYIVRRHVSIPCALSGGSLEKLTVFIRSASGSRTRSSP